MAYGVAAALVLLVGTLLIYAFGAGYFGYFTVPPPANFVVAPALFVGLMVTVRRFVAHRIWPARSTRQNCHSSPSPL
jgi:hypothetical protein